MKKLFINLISLYQNSISKATPPSCRFYPTCSHYSKEAFRVHGSVGGLTLSAKRLIKCHPFHPGGVDMLEKVKL